MWVRRVRLLQHPERLESKPEPLIDLTNCETGFGVDTQDPAENTSNLQVTMQI
jgi:hypothetical protein